MSRLRVVVLYGGRSVEREVSRVSARTIVQALDRGKYEVVPLAVDETGHFLSAAASTRLLAEGRVPERFRRAEPAGEALVPVEISPGRADVVFPIIHGATGEDGTLQGFLDFLGIPYVGAGVTGSAVGMDKAVFKALLASAKIPTPRSVVVRPSDRSRSRSLVAGLGMPLFVKPATGGSSVGVSKVKEFGGLDAALDQAFRYDDRALVEEAIDARELECAVLGDEDPRASVPGEVVPGHEFYDYDDKYREDKAQLLIPAPVSDVVAEEVRRLAVEVFRLCGISGMARVDFFLERGTDRVLVNEINTLPGFTAISMYPKLWEASGLPLPALLDELIALAIARRQRRASLSHEPPAELE
ncbi:MAG TPA: D-alanine--D-alanine ligase family protein [Thermoanaerobaculia bacterium]|nr:D-alanine--D-alanine ligase family protein [Thermoanaerobaculia bacterium]